MFLRCTVSFQGKMFLHGSKANCSLPGLWCVQGTVGEDRHSFLSVPVSAATDSAEPDPRAPSLGHSEHVREHSHRDFVLTHPLLVADFFESNCQSPGDWFRFCLIHRWSWRYAFCLRRTSIGILKQNSSV